jgi:hypothetical protein
MLPLQVVCHILHTADFCRDTLQGLATAVQKDVKQALAERVSGASKGSMHRYVCLIQGCISSRITQM